MAKRALFIALAAIACASTLSGCAVLAPLQNQPVRAIYAHWSDASHTSDPQLTPPAFVPHNATKIYVQTMPNDRGAILTYRSKKGPNSKLCKHGALVGKPHLDYNWWPDTKPPAEGMKCSPGWQVFREKGVTYAWQN
jgi:hypothetical protein